jgi:hypothetical protein
MAHRLSLAAALVAAPLGLYGCAAPAIEQAGTSCERLGLHVRVLDGQLAQERLVLGAATRQHEQQYASNFPLTDGPLDDARAGHTLRDRQASNLDELQDRLAVHEVALADARTLAAECRR